MPFTSTILMIRPAAFGYNGQTAVNNSFQQQGAIPTLQQKVLGEFDNMVATLRSAEIEVLVIEDTPQPVKPDAVFLNNWFCTLPDASVNIFPMYAKNRRIERRMDLIKQLEENFQVSEIRNWTKDELKEVYLEGTGSMVMDHDQKIIYACISARTNLKLLKEFALKSGYEICSFVAKDKSNLAIYHTNVLMCMGNWFCIACDEVINAVDQSLFIKKLKQSSKQLISISYHQMIQFAGNMLQLQNKNGDAVLVMSGAAFHSLKENQKLQLQQFTQLLPVAIPTIERIGGGSARCMMAEIFLQKKLIEIPQ
jgi:hypothetical protein